MLAQKISDQNMPLVVAVSISTHFRDDFDFLKALVEAINFSRATPSVKSQVLIQTVENLRDGIKTNLKIFVRAILDALTVENETISFEIENVASVETLIKLTITSSSK